MAAQKLITKHRTLETELIAHEHELDVVVATGTNLIEADHYDAATINARLAELQALWESVQAVRARVRVSEPVVSVVWC